MRYVQAIGVFVLACVLAVEIVRAFKIEHPAVIMLIGIPIGSVGFHISAMIWFAP